MTGGCAVAYISDLKNGGTGTSSLKVKIDSEDYSAGVLVQSNFDSRKGLDILGASVGKHMPENAIISEINKHENASIIVIIGTDMPLLPIQLRRMAKRGAIGIGRTGTAGGNIIESYRYGANGEEFGVVIEGELLLTADGTDYHILQGDAFCFKSNRSHRYSNPGQITTEMSVLLHRRHTNTGHPFSFKDHSRNKNGLD